jgi:Glyoxalase/Bleomycin resistance protein/Dioxygenase superfamily
MRKIIMLVGTHYQNGYVCDDIEAAIAVFKARGLTKDPMIIPVDQMVQTPDGPKRQKSRISMFSHGGVQYELIEVEIDETGVYANAPDNGGAMRFHHICLRVPEWDSFRAAIAAQDLPVVFERDLGPDQLRFLYLDGRKAFGHYLEYTCMSDATWDQISSM